MSETTAEHNTSNDDFDLEKHIEQECIKGSYDRLLPVIQKIAGYAEQTPNTSNINRYVQLENLSLELSRLALDFLAIQKGIVPPQRQPKLATQEQLEEIKEMLLKLRRT